ncbi:MAG TPA: hypothetical protein VM097_02325 [Mycobacteriales bacterium]|nr:hypothetical protein [Mycobacteriales bacterium]
MPTSVSTRSETDVLLDQLHGIASWMAEHPVTALLVDAAVTREARLDLVRHRDVVERQRQALRARTARQLQDSDRVLRLTAVRRVVIAHRNEWFRGKVAAGLQAVGVDVVADVDNGADAVGLVIAEQPDLLLVEDKLLMLNGLDVTRAARRYAARTVVVAQVVDDAEIGSFLEAGATTAYPRRTPPADVAEDLRALLGV